MEVHNAWLMPTIEKRINLDITRATTNDFFEPVQIYSSSILHALLDAESW
jgi:hypothetical protein